MSNIGGGQELDRKKVALLDKVLDSLNSFRVPHRFFLHFYVVSVISSLFWATQILMRGSILKALIENEPTSENSMPMDRITLTWFLMTAQGIRRLVESGSLAKQSASKMSLAHWFLGIAFYLAMGVAVWIEGAGRLLYEEGWSSANTFFDTL